MINKWQDVVKNRMRNTGETQESLAEKLNVTQGSIAHWLSGRRKPDTDIIASIMKAVGIKEITINDDGSASEKNIQYDRDANNFYIEVLDVKASAGDGYLNSDVQEVIKLIEYDNEQAKLLFNGISSNNLKVINISGDSMQGTFESGDAVYVDVSRRSFEGDGIYVFTFGRNLYVKRLQIIKNIIRVKSDNKLYDSWEIHEDEFDQLYIHGKVMLSQSMLLRKHG